MGMHADGGRRRPDCFSTLHGALLCQLLGPGEEGRDLTAVVIGIRVRAKPRSQGG
jgi:hypothetical protein